MREHFKQFIYNKEPSSFPAEVQQRLNYGRVHEIRKKAMFHNIIIVKIPGAIKSDCMLAIHLFWLAGAQIFDDIAPQNLKYLVSILVCSFVHLLGIYICN